MEDLESQAVAPGIQSARMPTSFESIQLNSKTAKVRELR